LPLWEDHYLGLTAQGHAILGNLSTDQMVRELTKISKLRLKTIEELKQSKHGHVWTKRERIEMDCIWVNLKNVGPPFFKIYITLNQNVIYTAGKSFSVVMWP